ncbi:unnamed protein product [Dicrocoelium dendriticum]|nr:unnamed protein product [Dicrocoelium dendriticum]
MSGTAYCFSNIEQCMVLFHLTIVFINWLPTVSPSTDVVNMETINVNCSGYFRYEAVDTSLSVTVDQLVKELCYPGYRIVVVALK